MDLLSYFRILRRRWLLIFACVVIGGALAGATTLLDSKTAKSRTYYKATNTQIFDSSTSSAVPSSVSNIDQMAVLVTTFGPRVTSYTVLAGALVAGGAIGAALAARVGMTAMPQLVAILHSFVGAAAVLVGLATALDHTVRLYGAEAKLHDPQRRHALRWGRPGEPLLTTNNYLLLTTDIPKPDDWAVSATTCERFDRSIPRRWSPRCAKRTGR